MAANHGPKHDFAPAWLKIPRQPDSKSSNNHSDHHSNHSEQSKRGGSHQDIHRDSRTSPDYSRTSPDYSRDSPDYSRLRRQNSYEAYHENSKARHSNKYRHHSADDDYYYPGYPPYNYGYDYYNGYEAEKYGVQYGSHPSLPPRGASSRSGQDFNKYQHPNKRFGQMNGVPPSYYDPYPFDYISMDSYYNYSNRSGKHANHLEKGAKNGSKDEKDKDGVTNGKSILTEDFPSLNGNVENSEENTTKMTNGGVWDHRPGKSLARFDTSQYANDSESKSAAIYRSLVPNKSSSQRKGVRINGVYGKVLTSAKSPPSNKEKEANMPSPTAPIEILNARLVTQPKNLGDKKSDFLRMLRQERSNSDAMECDKKSSQNDNAKSDDEILSEVDRLRVDEPSSDVLSSSLEAEQRLLREMGWDEADDDDYVITEDDMKEFQNLTKNVSILNAGKVQEQQPRNGLLCSLPKTWSPSHMPIVFTPTVQDLNETISSSSDSECEPC